MADGTVTTRPGPCCDEVAAVWLYSNDIWIMGAECGMARVAGAHILCHRNASIANELQMNWLATPHHTMTSGTKLLTRPHQNVPCHTNL